ncbi:hypothetical protein M514_16566 [Trichuris suis]|uniref:Uncharacterized protein n=1 Tax=Trichuris suis TaxID=68888 RepID=A0A085NP23_9BILA|nr:hypothetical protein M514_16566 [Trichuris suis]
MFQPDDYDLVAVVEFRVVRPSYHYPRVTVVAEHSVRLEELFEQREKKYIRGELSEPANQLTVGLNFKKSDADKKETLHFATERSRCRTASSR